jgi:hypothetical protein
MTTIFPYEDDLIAMIPEMLQTPTVPDHAAIIMRLYTSYSRESDNAKILQGIKWMSSGNKKAGFNERYADLIEDYKMARDRIFTKVSKIGSPIVFDDARVTTITDISVDNKLKEIMKLINKHDPSKVIFNFISIYVAHKFSGVDDAFGKVLFADFEGLV